MDIIKIGIIALFAVACQSQPKETTTPENDVPLDIAAINQVLQSNPDNVIFLVKRADLMMAESKWQAALEDLIHLTALDSTNGQTYEKLGDVYWQLKQIGESLNAYKAATRNNPESATAWVKLGKLFYTKSDYKTALDYLNQSLKLNPYLSDAYYWKAYVYADKGEKEKAFSNMQTAVDVDPENSDAYLKLGEWYTADSNMVAKDYYLTCLKIDSQQAVVWHQLGYFYQKIGDTSQSIASYKKSISLDSSMTISTFNMSFLNLESGNYAEALAGFERMLNIFPTDIESLLGKAMSLKYMGRKKEAMVVLQQIISLNPEDKEALEELRKLQ